MSHYSRINVKFTSAKSLEKALAEVFGPANVERSTIPTANEVVLKNDYRYSDQQVAFAIDRNVMSQKLHENNYDRAVYGGLGFRYENGQFEAIVDELNAAGVMPILDRVKQAYAKHEVVEQARRNGMSVQFMKTTDGTVNLRLTKIA